MRDGIYLFGEFHRDRAGCMEFRDGLVNGHEANGVRYSGNYERDPFGTMNGRITAIMRFDSRTVFGIPRPSPLQTIEFDVHIRSEFDDWAWAVFTTEGGSRDVWLVRAG
jgi:hypothetical protein